MRSVSPEGSTNNRTHHHLRNNRDMKALHCLFDLHHSNRERHDVGLAGFDLIRLIKSSSRQCMFVLPQICVQMNPGDIYHHWYALRAIFNICFIHSSYYFQQWDTCYDMLLCSVGIYILKLYLLAHVALIQSDMSGWSSCSFSLSHTSICFPASTLTFRSSDIS